MSTAPAMIVDDNEGDRYILKRLLSRSGEYDTVHEVMDGQEALEFLEGMVEPEGAPIDIFLDINMPRMDGFEFLERLETLRDRPGLSGAKVVMLMSSYDPYNYRERALQFSSVRGFVSKMPTDSADLLRQLNLGLRADETLL